MEISEDKKGLDVYQHALLAVCASDPILKVGVGGNVLTLADAAIKCIVAAKKGNHDAFNALIILGCIYADHSEWGTGAFTDEDYVRNVLISIYSENFKIDLPVTVDPDVWGNVIR